MMPVRARQLLLLAALVPASCSTTPSEGRWVGQVLPEANSAPAAGCRGPSQGVLTVSGKQALFSPDDGVVVLTGEAMPDGRIRASRSGTGADKKPYAMIFEGRIEGGKIVGTYAAPRCRAAVTLQPL